MIASWFLVLLGVYLFCGLGFAIPFVFVGVGKIDPHAKRGSWGFRFLILPGTIMLWPLLGRRWLSGIHEPPEERNAHRLAANSRGALNENSNSFSPSDGESAGVKGSSFTPHSI